MLIKLTVEGRDAVSRASHDSQRGLKSQTGGSNHSCHCCVYIPSGSDTTTVHPRTGIQQRVQKYKIWRIPCWTKNVTLTSIKQGWPIEFTLLKHQHIPKGTKSTLDLCKSLEADVKLTLVFWKLAERIWVDVLFSSVVWTLLTPRWWTNNMQTSTLVTDSCSLIRNSFSPPSHPCDRRGVLACLTPLVFSSIFSLLLSSSSSSSSASSSPLSSSSSSSSSSGGGTAFFRPLFPLAGVSWLGVADFGGRPRRPFFGGLFCSSSGRLSSSHWSSDSAVLVVLAAAFLRPRFGLLSWSSLEVTPRLRPRGFSLSCKSKEPAFKNHNNTVHTCPFLWDSLTERYIDVCRRWGGCYWEQCVLVYPIWPSIQRIFAQDNQNT